MTIAMKKEPRARHQVGRYTFEIVLDDAPSEESQSRWNRRSETIAAWLMEQWQREQRLRLAERN